MKHKQDNLEEQHSSDLEKHPKQDFQVERLAFFSDAVFAIAITLLIIDLKVPDITANTTYQEVLRQLFDLKYHFLAILFSFGLIAAHWYNHHSLFKYIHNYNTQLIVANMFVLLPIIFFPFITTFLAESIVSFRNFITENPDPYHYPNIFLLGFSLFFLNNFFAALAAYIFYWLATVKYKKLSLEIPMQEKIKFISNGLFRVIFFGVLSVVTLITSISMIILLAMIFVLVLQKILIKKLAKKLAER